jgi:putative acetyltransferase
VTAARAAAPECTADNVVGGQPLVVRALTDLDHASVHEILSSPTVIEGTMRVPHAALHETVARLAPRVGTHHLVADLGGRVVGILELVTWPTEPRHRHVGEINLVAVHPACAGQGAGRALTEAALDLADDWLDLRRLSLVVFADNLRALELYERLGFVIEGTMAEYGFKRGRYIDAHVMARLSRFVEPGPEVLRPTPGRTAHGRRSDGTVAPRP